MAIQTDTLQGLINAAGSGGTLELNAIDIYVVNTQVSIPFPITINFNGAKIEAGAAIYNQLFTQLPSKCLLNISGDTVVLNDPIFDGMSKQAWGAVYANGVSGLVMNNLTVNDFFFCSLWLTDLTAPVFNGFNISNCSGVDGINRYSSIIIGNITTSATFQDGTISELTGAHGVGSELGGVDLTYEGISFDNVIFSSDQNAFNVKFQNGFGIYATGCEFTGCGFDNSIVLVDEDHNANTDSFTIIDCTAAIPAGWNPKFFVNVSMNGITIEHNKIVNYRDIASCFYTNVVTVDNTTIYNNTFNINDTHPDWSRSLLRSSSGALFTDVSITYNTLNHTGDYALDIIAGFNASTTIDGVTIKRNKFNLIVPNAPSSSVTLKIIFGDSTCRGTGTVSVLPADMKLPLVGQYMWNTDSQWELMQGGVNTAGWAQDYLDNYNNNAFGLELPLAYRLSQDGQITYFLKHGHDGRIIYASGGEEDYNPGTTGKWYDALIILANAAIANLEGQGKTVNVEAIMFLGANDVNRGTTETNALAANFQLMYDSLVTDLGISKMTIMRLSNGQTALDAGRLATARTAAATVATAEVDVQYADTDDVTMNPDNLHFHTDGYLEIVDNNYSIL